MVPVHHAWLWFPERPGLFSGLIITGFGFGALIFNTMSLFLVNPNNESANADGKFSDDVNDKFPHMLRIVILCFTIMTLVAIALISPGPEESSEAAVAQRNLDNSIVEETISHQDGGENDRSPSTRMVDAIAMSFESERSSQADANSPEAQRKRIMRKKSRRKALKISIKRAKLVLALKSR